MAANIEKQFKREVSLTRYTTLGIGGAADWFFVANNLQDLVAAVTWAKKQGQRYLLLGNGSNILFPDEGFRGLVIHNRCQNFQIQTTTFWAEGGMPLAKMINLAAAADLQGPEQWIGIPGTVGGAVRGNAGTPDYEIKDSLIKATIFNEQGEVREVERAYFEFAYRESKLKHNRDLLLDATLRFVKGDPDKIEANKKMILNERIAKQPHGKSAGSFFKNPRAKSDKSAGYLIDQAGLKGFRIGDALVSPEHGNFLQNAGQATGRDFLALVNHVKAEVMKKFNIELEPEVQIIVN